jgi:hypothetical protein
LPVNLSRVVERSRGKWLELFVSIVAFGEAIVPRDSFKNASGDERRIDELTPILNMLDLTPQGRGKWYASLDYGINVDAARL